MLEIYEEGGGIAKKIDRTILYPVGKLLLEIKDIQNFQFEGNESNVFIRVTCWPYVLFSKKITGNKSEINHVPNA